MTTFDPQQWLRMCSEIARRALLALAGWATSARSSLQRIAIHASGPKHAPLAVVGSAFAIALLVPAPSDPPAPADITRSSEPVVAMQPMADRPLVPQVQPAAWEDSIQFPESLTPKLRPLPDPNATLFEPAGCQAPPAEYGPMRAGPRMLSARTVAMLEHAESLYAGRLDITDQAILPSPRGQESSGPDPEGEYGVVDLSVVAADGQVLYEEIDPLIRALRAAGFAAWLRDEGELWPMSEAYVHAVAIGDRQLSEQALAQLNGPDGYFLGGQGLNPDAPSADQHGGPVLCRWMRNPAVADSKAAPPARIAATTLLPWEDRLIAAAESFITEDPEASAELARDLGYLISGQEDPSNMCGPLSAAILRKAGLLPSTVGPVANLKSYWLANPATNGRPWSLFPADQYQVHHFSTGTDRFDFGAWPLLAGDFVYTYAGNGSFSHMFIVTEVDSAGRAYTVTNQQQGDGGYIVQRLLLYDPQDDQAGVFKSRCIDCGSWRRRTGLGGFEVLRRRDRAPSGGAEATHTVLPGEVLPQIALAYDTTLIDLVEFNHIPDPLALQVGVQLQVPSAGNNSSPSP